VKKSWRAVRDVKEGGVVIVILRRVKVLENERALVFRDGAFEGVLQPGVHWMLDPLFRLKVEVVSIRNGWLIHPDLESMVKSGRLGPEVRVVDLKTHQRAIVWADGRLELVLKPGVYALWTAVRDVRVDVLDAKGALFEHEQMAAVLALPGTAALLEPVSVESGHVGLLFRDGRHEATLAPGAYALWKGVARAKVVPVDLREQVVDVSGQDIMTADKVTLRMNAVVTFKVADALKAVTTVEDHRQALYREAQLALRAVVGARMLEALLGEKDAVARELDASLRARVAAIGLEVVSLGIRDVMLPGEMKELMNKVIEAQKAAEAALITRREETAAMRSQANTARILEQNPTLMRLREIEALEKVAEKGRLSVVVGEGGLAGRVVKLL
jgi:regulator of protease activity HflC (stomatin/prohibitin superfamily)